MRLRFSEKTFYFLLRKTFAEINIGWRHHRVGVAACSAVRKLPEMGGECAVISNIYKQIWLFIIKQIFRAPAHSECFDIKIFLWNSQFFFVIVLTYLVVSYQTFNAYSFFVNELFVVHLHRVVQQNNFSVFIFFFNFVYHEAAKIPFYQSITGFFVFFFTTRASFHRN